MKPSTRRFLRRWISFGAVMLALAVLGANRWVINSTDAYVFKDWALLPFNEVGVVLGTSKYMQSGKPSPEFRWRVTAAAELFCVTMVKRSSPNTALARITESKVRKPAKSIVIADSGTPCATSSRYMCRGSL